MIVIDVGCATYPQYPDDESTLSLIRRFNPSVYYGFDPMATKTAIFEGKSRVLIDTKAAWLYDGHIGYERGINPLRNRTAEEAGPEAVPCFDLAAFITDLSDSRIVLKLDCEGAEYELLPHLCAHGVDQLLELLLVEWHREPLDLPLRCPVEIW